MESTSPISANSFRSGKGLKRVLKPLVLRWLEARHVSSQSMKMVVSSCGIGVPAGGRGVPVKLILGIIGGREDAAGTGVGGCGVAEVVGGIFL